MKTPLKYLIMGELVGSDSPIAGLPQDATLVVAGPPMTGKYALMLTILSHYTDQSIVISTKNSADRVLDDFGEIAGERSSDRLGVIDCVNRPEGVDVEESTFVKHAGNPDNMTRIGVKFTELFDLFYDEESTDHVGVGLHSLSQLLMHSNVKSVYQFLQVLTGQIRSANWLGVAVIDTNVDEEDLQTLYHHFDGIVETRENDAGGRELRVKGLSPTSSEWAGF